jgi:chromosome segregation ATPase
MVFTNDNLDTIKGQISIVGETAAPPDKTKTATPADDKKKAPAEAEKAPPPKGEDYWRQKFADARRKLEDDTHELDILQREYNLKEQQYYSDPNTAMREQFNRQDLTDTKTKIDDKTAAVAQDKQDISDLEDALRQAGGEPGWENPPSSAPQP